MMQRWIDRLRESAVVRIPMKLIIDVNQRILPPPEKLVVSLQDLAPIWLRHNDDFRPMTEDGVARLGSGVEMTMAQALAPQGATRQVESEAPTPSPSASISTASVARVPRPAQTPLAAIQPRSASSVFVRDYILPYQGMLHTQGVLVPLVKLIDILEEYGQCPSVVLEQKTQDEECADLYSIRDTLAQVNLKDHTHRVTRHGLAALMASYKDPEPLIPKMLVACLGHDLGKIPAFRASGLYSMRDHPAISIVKVKEAFEGHDVFWLEEVCQVIGAHHRHVKDGFSSLLKQADGRAREEEVAFVTQTMEIKQWEDWFTVPEFLALIEPLINMGEGSSGRKQEWVAVSVGGVVYCQTNALYGIVKELARMKKIVDIHLLRMSDKEEVMRRVAKSLAAAGVLADPIGEGFYGRKYSLRLQSKKQLGVYCVPIVETAFHTPPSVLQQRKTGFFTLIEEVLR
jgi:hypothetical protein